jgi:hypothetical protein
MAHESSGRLYKALGDNRREKGEVPRSSIGHAGCVLRLRVVWDHLRTCRMLCPIVFSTSLLSGPRPLSNGIAEGPTRCTFAADVLVQRGNT